MSKRRKQYGRGDGISFFRNWGVASTYEASLFLGLAE
jgi:hypothetical protein